MSSAVETLVSRARAAQAIADRWTQAQADEAALAVGWATWGGNSIFDNLNYRYFLNITRVVCPLAPERAHEPTDDEVLGAYRAKHGV